MSSKGLVTGLVAVSIIAGALYLAQDEGLIGSRHNIKITSNSRWSAFITYMKNGVETTGWFTGGNNKTLEFDFTVTEVNVGWDMQFGTPPLKPYITVEIYKGKKLLYSETVKKWATVDWNSGIRIIG